MSAAVGRGLRGCRDVRSARDHRRGSARPRCGSCRRRRASVPAWNTSAPLALAASSPSIAVTGPRPCRIARRRKDERDRRARQRRDPSLAEPWTSERLAQVAACRREQQRPERDGQTRHDRLRLRVAEPGVALEEHRTVLGQHQSGVEGATERGTAAGQLGEDRPVERLDDVGGRLVGEVRRADCRRPCRRCSDPGRRRGDACGRGRPAARRHPGRHRAR